jgi:hypothetical protein
MARDPSKTATRVVTAPVKTSSVATTKSVPKIGSVSKKISQLQKDLKREGLGAEKLTLEPVSNIEGVLSSNSLTNLRPEIVSSIELLPAFDSTARSSKVTFQNQTDVSKLLDTQSSIRSLYTEDLAQTIDQLSQGTFLGISSEIEISQIFGEILLEYNKDVQGVNESLKLMTDILANVEKISKGFNVSANKNEIEGLSSSRRENRTDTRPSGRFSKFDDILSNWLNFSTSNLARFSNTKILAQIITDLRICLSGGSQHLFPNPARLEDTSALRIWTLEEEQSDFSFSLPSIASVISVPLGSIDNFDPVEGSDFNSFQESLPVNDQDKIKVLISAFSKEIRMSSGILSLGRQSSISDRFDLTEPGGLIRITGDPGKKITGEPARAQSLSSILRVQDESENVILPFEQRIIIDDEENKTYLSGKAFFIDTILNSETPPSTAAAEEYASVAKNTIDEAVKALNNLLGFASGDESNLKFCQDVYRDFLGIVRKSFEDYDSERGLVVGSLLSVCQTDLVLKHLVYKYLLSLRTGEDVQVSIGDPSRPVTIGLPPAGTIESGRGFAERAASNASDSISKLGTKGEAGESFTPTSPDNLKFSRANPISTKINPIAGVTTDQGKTSSVMSIRSTLRQIQDRLSVIVDNSQQFDPTGTGLSPKFDNEKAPAATVGLGEISTLLSKDLDENGIFKEILDVVDDLTGTLSKGTDYLTRMNKLSDDTLLLLGFEIASLLISQYAHVEITSSDDGKNFKLFTNEDLNSVIEKKIAAIQEGASISFEESSGDSLFDLQTELVDEDNFARDLIDALSSVVDILKNQVDEGSKSSQSPTTPEAIEAVKGLTSTQLIIANYTNAMVMRSRDPSYLSNEALISQEEINSLNSLLKEPLFTAPSGNNIKILSVGMPSGLQDALKNPVFYTSADDDQAFKIADTDVITVEVYKVETEFEDLIFKPQKFIFDMTSFAEVSGIVSDTDVFDKVKSDNFTLTSIDEEGNVEEGITLVNAVSRSISGNRTSSGELFENHIISFLLETYVRLFLGAGITESTFLTNEALLDVPRSDAVQRLLRVLETSFDIDLGVGPETLGGSGVRPDTLGGGGTRPSSLDGGGSRSASAAGSTSIKAGVPVINTSELARRVRQLESTVLLNTAVNKAKVLQTNLFERIFHLPVDPDNFEIDLEKTRQTESGRNLLNSDLFLECTTEEIDEYGDSKLFLKEREYEMSEMFVVISLGNNL